MEWLKARASVSSSIRAYFLYIINTYPPTTGIHVKVDERSALLVNIEIEAFEKKIFFKRKDVVEQKESTLELDGSVAD